MDRDDRAVVCLLADTSTEESWCEWAHLASVQRIALQAAIAEIINDSWERQKIDNKCAHALASIDGMNALDRSTE